MRTVAGRVLVPATTPDGTARRLVVDVSDVSLADASAVLLASVEMRDVAIGPGARVAFALAEVPDGAPRASLAARAHVDMDGTGRFAAGDLLTTVHVPVPLTGDVDDLEVPVSPI